MLVTIIADASYCPETGAGGYGFHVVCERGRREGSGAMRAAVHNNNAAEMMALANALHRACAWGMVVPGDHVLLQTDSEASIAGFKGLRKNISAQEAEVARNFAALAVKAGVTTEFRHVKGHTRGKTPRTWVNNKCDSLAGDAMRTARARIRQQQANTTALSLLD